MIQAKKFAAGAARFFAERLVPISVMGVGLSLFLFFGIAAESTYTVTDLGKTTVVRATIWSTPEEVLEKSGITLDEHTTYTLTKHDSLKLSNISVTRAFPVSVTADGKTKVLYSTGETVASLLERAGVALGDLDEANYSSSAITRKGMEVAVSRCRIAYVTELQSIPYSVVLTKSPDYYVGTRTKLNEGQTGEKQLTYAYYVRDNQLVSRELVGDVILKDVVNAVEVEGTKEKPVAVAATNRSSASRGTSAKAASSQSAGASEAQGGGKVTTKDGTVLSYRKVLTCTATAYYEAPSVAITATGTTPHWGVIAVDPRVIPLGTRVYITNTSGSWEYAVAVAEDTGGAIKGNKVDLFMNSISQCFDFGRRKVNVYILD